MYSIIIIDDEINIRNGISKYIEINHPDIKVAATFEDGYDAIEYLKDHNVDIVITDVKMITVSGIEIARYVYNNLPSSKVIILSGYREFEYAREALTYNVKHYLTKPTDFDELSSVIDATIQELSKERRQNRSVSYYEKYRQMFKDELLSDILMGVVNDVETLESKFDLLETTMPLSECRFAIVGLYMDNYSDYLENNWMYGKDQLNEVMENFIESQNTDKIYFFMVLSYKGEAKLLGIVSSSYKENIEDVVSMHLKKVSDFARENLNLHFNFLIEKTYDSAKELLEEKTDINNFDNLEEQIRLLVTHINKGDDSCAESIIQSISDRISSLDLNQAQEMGLSVLSTMANILDKKEYIPCYEKGVNSQNDIDSVSTYIYSEILKLTNQLLGSKNKFMVIEKAKEYIEANYGSDISLADVADYVFLNPVYFSRYFKQYTGMNFIDYLLDVRMKHAKKLLSEDFSIKEITKICGYSSVGYFSQSFKKHMGITPKAYRLNLSRIQKYEVSKEN